MDRLYEMSAAGEPVKIGGKTYTMKPLKADHFGEAEVYMISKRPSPLEIVTPRLAELSPELRTHLLDAAYRDERNGQWIPQEDVLNWLTGNAIGKVFCFWCWIKQAHPEVTLEDAEQLRIRYAAELGDDPVPDLGLPQGNLPSQPQQAVEKANGGLFHGARSTGIWRWLTGGRRSKSAV